MPERPSRQDLVVSPQASNLRFALTACGCASAGFGIVWASLAIRGLLGADEAHPRASDGTAPVTTTLTEPAAEEPSALPLAHLPPSRFTPVGLGSPTVEPASYGDEGVAVGSLDEPPLDDAGISADNAPQPARDRYGSRTGFRPMPPAASPPGIGQREEGLLPAGAEEPIEVDHHPANGPEGIEPPESDSATTEPAGLASTASRPRDEPLADDPLEIAGNRGLAEPTDADDEASLPEDRGDLLATPLATNDAGESAAGEAPTSRAVPSPPAAAPTPVNPFAVAPSMPIAPAAGARGAVPPRHLPDPLLPSATTDPAPDGAKAMTASGKAAGYADAPEPSGAGDHDPDAPVAVDSLPSGGPSGPAAGAMPFAAAPPLASAPPGTFLSPTRTAPAPDSASAGKGPTGQGRPGAIQLEGVQTPQLAVEKRAPREIQVGKTARFEILVRNVGSAVANDVILRDSVPFGTALVATTPPASPTGDQGAPGELAWLLGTLPPGGQARVALDLMPMTEGDVGSVASVSFRADASVRSRATRPALEIGAVPPSPVLVGQDTRLSITISNPGSGAATGVILEGLLPEGLAHRAGRELEFDVGSLPPGESRTIDLVLATTGPGVHGLKLVARADGQIEVVETVKVAVTAPTLELAVQMPSRRYLQRPATCTIAMTNAGTAPAIGVELAAQLPPGMKFVRANNAGYYEERTHRVLWNLEELPAAETGEVEVVVMPIALGPQRIVAAARTTAGLSDQKTHTVEVEGLAALAFEVADSEDPIEIGGTSEYVIRVGNQGTKPASGVRVVATLLGDMEPVDARGPSPHRVDNLTISFEPLAKLAPSEEALYRIRVRGRREGDQRVQVQLTSDEQQAPITKEEITRVYADR
jgi:uncharacterized repeat protein (TIGR01451 family)